jgi:hypothetical protein
MAMHLKVADWEDSGGFLPRRLWVGIFQTSQIAQRKCVAEPQSAEPQSEPQSNCDAKAHTVAAVSLLGVLSRSRNAFSK